jgi:hypothetical protein
MAGAGKNILETTTGSAVAVGRSEDASQDNVQIAVWDAETVGNITVVRFTPSQARLLAELVGETAEVLEQENPGR